MNLKKVFDEKDTCLRPSEVKEKVDEKLSKYTKATWESILKSAIRNEIQTLWDDEIKKSKHYSHGKGWIYFTDGGSAITQNANYEMLEEELKKVLDTLF